MKLSISIVSWNTREYLQQCLESVFNHLDGLDAEVIVVDNDSQDLSSQMVREKFPKVRLIETGENLGFARANNMAFRVSSGEYFLLLNSDTVVQDEALSIMLRFMDSYPLAGAVGCRLLNGDGTLQRSCSPFPTPASELYDALYLSKLFPKSRIFGRFSMSYWGFDSIREVGFAGGSCLMLRRNALEQVGLLDEDYFMYTEEADLCYRLGLAGWKTFYLPDAKVIHFGGQSSRLDVNRTSVDLCRSKYRFMRKHYGRGAAMAYRGIIIISSMLRLLAWTPEALLSPRRKIYGEKLSVQRSLLSWAVMVR